MYVPLALLRDDDLLFLGFGLVLARPSVFSAPLLFDPPRVEHRVLELRG